MAKRNDYFKLLEQQMEFPLKAGELLENIINNYNKIDLIVEKTNMHNIERDADDLYHDISSRLSSEFITAIDQEDILLLTQSIDDITDALDETAMEFYMYHIKEVPYGCLDLIKMVNKCIQALNAVIIELRNYKKSSILDNLLKTVAEIETDQDALYVDAIYNLFGSEEDPRKLLSHRKIFESLENVCDLCRDAVDLIAQIIIKNT